MCQNPSAGQASQPHTSAVSSTSSSSLLSDSSADLPPAPLRDTDSEGRRSAASVADRGLFKIWQVTFITTYIHTTMLYYLEDDDVIHPISYKLIDNIDNNKLYTFNQLNRLKGKNISVGRIDTAMVVNVKILNGG